jgi:hypothetical protein
VQGRRFETGQILAGVTTRARKFEVETQLLSLAKMNLSAYEMALIRDGFAVEL